MTDKATTKEEFDTTVTGELTHMAIWLENEVAGIISDHFCKRTKQSDFSRIVLRRDGLTFQDKIDIARAMISSFNNAIAAAELKHLLADIESFKTHRNALVHGVDVTPSGLSELALHVESVGRTGKPKVVVITEKSHTKMMSDATDLLSKIEKIRKNLPLKRSG